ncbi:MAG: hypothetical protein EA418_04050 [Wenzhouxiangellaceae bacterium]|nr:MAG: hypothetical protein EA418_04050 [Wenzhouxiangellaceae bacterium]
MQLSAPENPARFLLLSAVCISLLLHLALLQLKLSSGPVSTAPSPLAISLLPAPTQAKSNAQPDSTEEQIEQTPTIDPATERSISAATVEVAEPVPGADQAVAPATIESPAPTIDTTHVLGQLRLLDRAGSTRDRSADQAHGRIPALPDPPSWLNDYVGPVTPEGDFWQEMDGSRRARIVTADGSVFCGRTDPPSIQDDFNPQFSTNVMRWNRCGRERPTPVDRTDPWMRQAGRGR